ncbi:hypothetical protein GWK47_052504 [Chionoecetes opilio]|uniref:Uncharacterized protein n=1 Tax=Chionoecetes opilio TaxID=41210 RepID=A0A8J4Y195_CHIOP|nr:hypothetical protein GWK47_052504 [Chionoecetes opilio]
MLARYAWSWPLSSSQSGICGYSRYGGSDTHHQTSACQCLWRVHPYAIAAIFGESDDGESETRVDASLDTYKEASLKSQARTRRGETSARRTRVSAKIPLPKGGEWQKFLKDYQNNDELFQFISQELQRNTTELQDHLLTTKADLVLSNKPTDLTALSPCHQEEADTRMMLHLRHAAEQGHTKAYIRTVDSDVVVLAMNLFLDLGFLEL